MTRDDTIARLISVRHHCFVRGVLGNRKKGYNEWPGDDFLQAFRTVNRLYIELRDNIARRSTHMGAQRRRAAA
jgi:hypothetical protein